MILCAPKPIDKTISAGYNTLSLRECWNGRQARLRCVWFRRVGSSPISRTIKTPTPGGVGVLIFQGGWDSNN